MRSAYCKGVFLSFPSILPFLPFDEQGLAVMHSISNYISLARTQSYVTCIPLAYNPSRQKVWIKARDYFFSLKFWLLNERHNTIQLANWAENETLRWDTPITTKNKAPVPREEWEKGEDINNLWSSDLLLKISPSIWKRPSSAAFPCCCDYFGFRLNVELTDHTWQCKLIFHAKYLQMSSILVRHLNWCHGQTTLFKTGCLRNQGPIELNYGNWTGNPRAGGSMMGGHTVGQLP